MSDRSFTIRSQDIGSRRVGFGDGVPGGTPVEVDGEIWTLLPATPGTYMTELVDDTFINSFFFIKWFTSAEPVTMLETVEGVGTVTFSCTPDSPVLGSKRFKSIPDGTFDMTTTNSPDRTIPSAQGPVRQAKLDLSAIPTGATHFVAWMTQY